MAIVTPYLGERKAHAKILAENLTYRLYANDVTPDNDTVIGDLTEVTAAGYAAETVTGGTWTIATSGGVTAGTNTAIDFVLTEAATAYGYYVIDSDGDLRHVERFSTAAVFSASGGTITVNPRIQLD